MQVVIPPRMCYYLRYDFVTRLSVEQVAPVSPSFQTSNMRIPRRTSERQQARGPSGGAEHPATQAPLDGDFLMPISGRDSPPAIRNFRQTDWIFASRTGGS